MGVVIPIRPPGLWSLEARAYLLLSLAHDTALSYGVSEEQHRRARTIWPHFIARHPQFKSPLFSETATNRWY